MRSYSFNIPREHGAKPSKKRSAKNASIFLRHLRFASIIKPRMVGPHYIPHSSQCFHHVPFTLMNHEPSFTTNHNIPTISRLYTLLYAHKIPAFPRVFSSQSSQDMGLPTTRKASAQALRRPGKFRNGPLRNVESTGYGGFKQQNVGIYRDVIGIL